MQWWVNGKRRGKTWGTGAVGRRWMSSSFTWLSTAVCILKLFNRRMRSFFSRLEMKQHVVKWLSDSLEPFKDDVLNAVLVNLVAVIWWLLFITLMMARDDLCHLLRYIYLVEVALWKDESQQSLCWLANWKPIKLWNDFNEPWPVNTTRILWGGGSLEECTLSVIQL